MFYSGLTFTLLLALFFAIVVSLALRPATTHRLTVCITVAVAVSSLLFYGFGYGMNAASFPEALREALRALFFTILIFVGRENSAELLRVAPWFAGNVALQILLWLTQLAALYVTTTTLLTTIGRRLLRKLREFFLRWHRVCIMYGSISRVSTYCADIARCGLRPLLVSDSDSADFESAADEVNGALWRESAVSADGRWLRRLGIRPGGRALELVCDTGDDGLTKKFLLRFIGALKARGIQTQQIHICVVCRSEANFDFLSHVQLESGKFISADVYSTGYLAAKSLIAAAAPCQVMSFDGNARADGDFGAMIVGFGDAGQNVLRLLVRNGQFLSSRFSAVVVDRDLDGCSGAFCDMYPDMLRRYNISFVQADANSGCFIKTLRDAARSLRYIAVCTGSEDSDRQVLDLIRAYRLCHAALFPHKMVVALCSKERVILCGVPGQACLDSASAAGDEVETRFPTVRGAELVQGRMDTLARGINSIYLKKTADRLYPGGGSEREEFYRNGWYRMDSVSRMSCRAAAAFIPAMLLSAAGGGTVSAAQCRERARTEPGFLDALSRQEHLRWNAFESSIGVSPMGEAEFKARIAAAEGGAKSALAALEADEAALERSDGSARSGESERLYDEFRRLFSVVRKDIPSCGIGGIHACLADWDSLVPLWADYEALDALSRRIEQLRAHIMCLEAGRGDRPELPDCRNFQQLDTDNVEGILELLCADKT